MELWTIFRVPWPSMEGTMNLPKIERDAEMKAFYDSLGIDPQVTERALRVRRKEPEDPKADTVKKLPKGRPVRSVRAL
jgi:hypothetical protein